MTEQADCADTASAAILQAVDEFNRGDWYDCHETLEDLWIGSEDESRRFYQGMLQISVALLHWSNGNYGGAVSLLASGGEFLRRVSPICQQIEVAALAVASGLLRAELTRLGPERMSELSGAMIPKIRLAAPSYTAG